jgi:quinol monooxygenase YgiN
VTGDSREHLERRGNGCRNEDVIIVTGSVKARPDTLDELLRISLEHVHRSRLEPGCLLHTVHHDVESPHRLVFLEHWSDRDALDAHFHVPESAAFAKALGVLAAEPPRIDVYDAVALSF